MVRVRVRVRNMVSVRVSIRVSVRVGVADCCIQTAGESDKMRINHVIKTDQWRAAPQTRPAPHFVVSLKTKHASKAKQRTQQAKAVASRACVIRYKKKIMHVTKIQKRVQNNLSYN